MEDRGKKNKEENWRVKEMNVKWKKERTKKKNKLRYEQKKRE